MIVNRHDLESFRRLLGDGGELGLQIDYAVQERPEGIAQAFLIARDFIADSGVCLALGDNVFYGQGFPKYLRRAVSRESGATVFAYRVQDPQRYGVVQFDEEGRALNLIEKPENAASPYAVTGLYFYDSQVVKLAEELRPSARGELEITDLNARYLKSGALTVEKLGRGIAWLDAGTPEALMQASNFIQAIEARQGLKVACVEEIAFRMGYITEQECLNLAKALGNSLYGEYLLQLLQYPD